MIASGKRARVKALTAGWAWLVPFLFACAADPPGDTTESRALVAEDAPSPPPAAPIAPEWCEKLPRAQYAELERVMAENTSDWFEVYLVGDGVFALYEPLQWQEVISYLILGEERALLFDTGLGVAKIRPLVEHLTQLPVMVLNSHTHYDHIGGNFEFDEVLARDTAYTRARVSGQSNASLRDELAPQALCGELPTGVSQDSFTSQPWQVTRWLGEDERIDLGARTLRVLAIPGHAPDAVVLVDEASGYVWTGDSFYEGPIWLFDVGTDLEAYRRAVDVMADLARSAKRIFPAHNTPLAQPQLLLELQGVFEAAWAGGAPDSERDDGIVVFEHERFSLLIDPQELP